MSDQERRCHVDIYTITCRWKRPDPFMHTPRVYASVAFVFGSNGPMDLGSGPASVCIDILHLTMPVST